ncbi:T9SS type A sorting domain-containing protein [Flavobacterium sp. N502540]|uniref:T9SS type A sorting domain-containing protein n=1 Tax=Flavobacterium sp. N502540 TaxID=2986838 RepID=UPI002224A264|nr:T9SS type A sorting domain-containing protein [Flavobacterium sp. N502540]
MKTKLLLLFFTFLIVKSNAQKQVYSFLSFYPTSSIESNFVQFNDKIFFEAPGDGTGREVWTSDGTPDNTFMLKDINIGSGNSIFASLKRSSAILNNNLYFIAKDADSNGEIWKTDGTTNGTVKLTNFLNGRGAKLTTVGAFIFFTLINDDHTLEVWKTDGTINGTLLVKDNLPIAHIVSFQGKCNNTFIFTFESPGTNQCRVWRSDGTSYGTFPITEEVSGNGSGFVTTEGGAIGGGPILTQYIEHNGKLYFVTSNFLFETDGTLKNTKSIANVKGDKQGSVFHSDIIEANNNLYLMFFRLETNNISILKFDLVNNSINSVYENTSSHYFSPSNFMKVDDSLLFTSSNSTGNTSLVLLNLANNEVSNIKDLTSAGDLVIRSGYLPYYISSIFKINKDEYFVYIARDKNNKRKGWILNNTLGTIENVSILDNILEPIVYKDYLYYAKDNKLWKYSNNLSTIDVTHKKAIVFYPNPSSDLMQLNVDNSNEVENISVFDLNGKLLQTLSNSSQIDISSLSKGIYTAQIKWNGTLINKKIIKN